MRHELKLLLETIEKPLLFAFKNNFSNLNKVKSLESTVNDCTLKFLSKNPPHNIKKIIIELKNHFFEFENSDFELKKRKIFNSLEILNNLRQLSEIPKVDSSVQNLKSEVLSGDPSSLDIRYLKGVGPKISSMLNKKAVNTVEDLIFYFPRRYDDRRYITNIIDIVPGNRYTVVAAVHSVGEVRNKRSRFFKVVISDGTSKLDLIWFNFKASYLRSIFKKSQKVIVNGEVILSSYQRSLQIVHPANEDIEIIEDEESVDESLQFNRIVPIYPLTEGLTQRRLRKIINNVLENYLDHYDALLSHELIKRFNLMNLKRAIKEVHFPADTKGIIDITNDDSIYGSVPHRTLVFFEFFVLELGLTYKKKDMERKSGISFKKDSGLVSKLIKSLPFTLTKSQNKVVDEIKMDMSKKNTMNRLLQGDVGSGKTIVALTSILRAIDSGYQAVFMVPTEILSEQHYKNIKQFLKDFDIKIGLLKSAISKKEKDVVYREIKDGKLDLVIGTHALIQEGVEFHKLGIVVIDEQHKFGVLQRAKLVGKALNPDLLIMTATPIPRTLAITVYGDLD
ncbi:MAG: ATP-dependent DNA helicase RecG, partial [Thermodesulfobacteriota bacterium]